MICCIFMGSLGNLKKFFFNIRKIYVTEEKIMRKIQKEIILKNYFLKNSSINIFQRIIQLCLTDINISGICAVDPEIIFENKTFCVTGILSRGTRTELQNAIRDKGGISVNSISKKTDYLIIGDTNNACWSYACYGRKVEKALDLRKSGHTIVLVHEFDVFDAI